MQNVTLRARGLFTFPNSLGEVPDGAFAACDNVVVDRDGTVNPRRGFAVYGSVVGGGSSRAKQLASYKDRVLRHWSTNLEFDSDGAGAFTTLSSSISEPSAGTRIKYSQANGNFYFTSNSGIQKISATNAAGVTPSALTLAGGLKALDGVGTVDTSAVSGWFTQDSQVAYRVVWGFKDVNTNEILGYPSDRIVVVNPMLTLMVSNFNTLCANLATAVTNNATYPLSDGDYATFAIPANSTATTLLNQLKAFANGTSNKLDLDLSPTYTGDVTTGSPTILNVSSTHGLHAGMKITNANVPAGTTIVSVVGTTVTMSANATGTVVGTSITFNNVTFQAITAPAAPSVSPTTVELLAVQAYYDAIVNALNASNGIGPAAFTAIGGAFLNSTQSTNCSLTFTVPANATVNHYFQVYRSALATSTSTTSVYDVAPDDELRLVYEANPTAGQISSKTITWLDNVPESFRSGGANLYTNANTGEGILQANEVPPWAMDLTLFKGFTFFANTKTKYRLELSLLGVSGLLNKTFTLTYNGVPTVYTFSATEDAPTQKVKVSTAATPAQQVDETARSLVRVINKQSTQGVNAFYVSGVNDVPGMILLETTVLGSISFSVQTQAGTATNFSPDLTTSRSAANDVNPNRLYYSKYQQPEAVPLLNYRDVGPKDKAILRILPLRDSLFILSEQGIYRLSGDNTNNFQIFPFDLSTQLKCPDSAVVLNNQIYMLSSQGVVSVSDTGVSVVSRPIENLLLPLNSPTYTAFVTSTFGVAYESDRSYLLWTVKNTADTYATVVYRFNTFTNTWVSWSLPATCGAVDSGVDRMFLGDGTSNVILRERKDFTRLDYADREYAHVIPAGSITGAVVTLPSLYEIEVGDCLVQTQYLSIDQFNRLLSRLDMDSGLSNHNYLATLQATTGVDLRAKLTSLATKLDADAGLATHGYVTAISGYSSSFADCQAAFNVIVGMLNSDANTKIKNYSTSTGTVAWEAYVSSISGLTVTMDNVYPLIAGAFTVYKHIDSYVQWAPHFFGDPSMTKQVSESTLIFETMAFRQGIASFASDLSTGLEEVAITGEGTGTWGSSIFGQFVYGGEGTNRPFRTYIPRDKQRCRYITAKFRHKGTFEKYAVFGLSFTYEMKSSRGYR